MLWTYLGLDADEMYREKGIPEIGPPSPFSNKDKPSLQNGGQEMGSVTNTFSLAVLRFCVVVIIPVEVATGLLQSYYMLS